MDEKELNPSDLAGIYKDIAEVIGVQATVVLHNHFQGQQITLPKKLYSKMYIVKQVEECEMCTSVKAVALKFGYTERRLRQILKEGE